MRRSYETIDFLLLCALIIPTLIQTLHRGECLGSGKWTRVAALLMTDGLMKPITGLASIAFLPQNSQTATLSLIVASIPATAFSLPSCRNLLSTNHFWIRKLRISRTTGSRIVIYGLSALAVQTQVSLPLIISSIDSESRPNFVVLVTAMTISRVPLAFSSAFVVPSLVAIVSAGSPNSAWQHISLAPVYRRLIRVALRLSMLATTSFIATASILVLILLVPIRDAIATAGLLAIAGGALAVAELLSAASLIQIRPFTSLTQWVFSFILLFLGYRLKMFGPEVRLLVAMTLASLGALLPSVFALLLDMRRRQGTHGTL